MKKTAFFAALTIISGFMLVSCSDSSTDAEGKGRIKMYLVDAPAALDSVIIDVLRVEVNSELEGWQVINDVPGKYDLLRLTNGASVVLGENSLSAGNYMQVRLILGDDNYIYENGIKHSLTVPSGQQTGLKLNHEFTIEPGSLYELYLDFDADKSIHQTGSNKYLLRPTVRVQAVVTSGTISGQILPLDADASVWTMVGDDTLTTYADVNGLFKLMCLPAGNYSVNIEPGNIAYQPKTITDVVVYAQQDTDLGVITLDNN